MKKTNAFRALILLLTIATSFMGMPFTAKAAPTPGSLIKRADHPAVYYFASNSRRYVFPNEQVFRTWYADFSTVQTVTADELAAITIGGNVTYRPGLRMIKIDTDPSVYAISRGGVLRLLPSEAVAAAIFGSGWASLVDDIPDPFFVNYTDGAPITSASDYSPSAELASATTINADKGLGDVVDPTPTPPPAPSCTADTWTCTDWNMCSASGTQTRSCTMTTDCAGVVTPSPATSQSCTPPPPPTTGPMPTVPSGSILVDAITDNGFETSTGGFAPNGASSGSVSRVTTNVIAGTGSLRASFNRYGRIAFAQEYPYAGGPIADSVTVKAKVRVDSASASNKNLQICAVVYLQTSNNQRTKCQDFRVNQGVKDVFLTYEVGGQQIARTYFQLKLDDDGTLVATLDDAHLYIVQRGSATPAPEPTPSCTADTWSCTDWNACSTSGSQTRTCTMTSDCAGVTTPSPATTQSCTPGTPTPSCTADTWTCTDWNACSASGSQTRSCTMTTDCAGVTTPSPATSQSCTPPPPASDSTNLEISGYNSRPTTWRSMTAEMDLRNDVSSNGAAVNTTPKDVTVRLVPAADAVGQTRRVSFGFPLPPGTLVNTNNIRVTNAAGQEIPAFVRSLGAWERMPDQRLLCNGLTASGNPGIRSVLVQFDMAFSSTSPVNVTIGLNRARTQSLTSETAVRDTYRVANDGTYASSVNTSGLTIREPAVLAAIDHRYLDCTNVFPMVNAVGTQPYLAATDKATDDFFYSLINQQYPKKQSWPVTSSSDYINFYTDPEPWLYDRTQTFYNGYFRTGNVDMLREAHRAADHYAQNIYGPENCSSTYYPYCVGSFRLKNPNATGSFHDMKYSYSESLLSNYLLTGDASVLRKIGYISWGFQFHHNLLGTGDTERHRGYALLAHAIDAELTGSAHQRSYATNAMEVMRARQTSPLNGNQPNGCFNYPPEGETNTFSPWMSSLLGYGFLRGYQATGYSSAPAAIVDLAQCEVTRGITSKPVGGEGPMSDGRWYPYYIARSFGTPGDTDPNPSDGFEHALDVSSVIALGAYLTQDMAQRANLQAMARELLLTHDESIAYWTRDNQATRDAGRAIYRTTPPRKFLWQYKNAPVIGWALGGRSIW
ncbi:MAG: hypothetical protein QY323_03780 [Patescibacteria group bacterium]|nr:MAG: hypothetical protein QY323_03780 [Patescibacteria group bacterium]